MNSPGALREMISKIPILVYQAFIDILVRYSIGILAVKNRKFSYFELPLWTAYYLRTIKWLVVHRRG